MNTTIYFIRHGDVHNPDNVIYGRSIDVPLTEKGRHQIRSITTTLQVRGVVPDAIYTSPLSRAVDSGRTIQEIFPDVPLSVEEGLMEADQTGCENFTISWMDSVAGNDVYNYTGPELADLVIERPEEMAKRMLDVVNKLHFEHQGQTIFVVGHGDTIGFMFDRIRNPQAERHTPRGQIIRDGFYLEKGEALQINVGADGTIIDYQVIRAGESGINREREV